MLVVPMISLLDLAATRRAGAALAPLLRGGDVVALLGDLGAGKTTFVDACVCALGADGASSPTFALVHEIPCAAFTVWHIDLYRLERAAEVAELGLEEMLGNPAGVSFVEWADKHPVLPRVHLRLTLAHTAGGRTLSIEGHGARGEALGQAFAAALTGA